MHACVAIIANSGVARHLDGPRTKRAMSGDPSSPVTLTIKTA